MQYLTRRAAQSFLSTTRSSYFGGLASWTETLGRLSALREMCQPGTSEGAEAARVLQLEGWVLEERWMYEAPNAREATGPRTGTLQLDGEDDEPTVIFFFPGAGTGLSAWEFHQADDDYFPSIPHGHHQGRSQPKLDPYQGWVYRGTEQIERVPRRNIVLLWNDAKFRKFAAIAIDYYLNEHPHYNGWRVADPLRLPRRR